MGMLQIFDFSLSEAEMKAIEGLNTNIRFVELLMYVLCFLKKIVSSVPV